MPAPVDFVFDIGTLTDTYATLLNRRMQLQTAQSNYDAQLGLKPVPPTIVTEDSDWNTYVSGIDVWTATTESLLHTLNVKKHAYEFALFAVRNTCGCGSDTNPSSWILDEWIRVITVGTGAITEIGGGYPLPGYPGAGYTAGDVLTIPGGMTAATITVDSVGIDGSIAGFTLADGGTGYGPAIAVPVTGGTGSGFTVDILSVDGETYWLGVQSNTWNLIESKFAPSHPFPTV